MLRIVGLIFLLQACSTFERRPKLELLLAQATLLSARDLGAAELAKSTYFQGERKFILAREAYRLKDFQKARILSIEALKLAEMAEYEALKNKVQKND